MLVPSGQAAVTVVMLSVPMPGDRVLFPDHVYPPVQGFCANYLRPRGIESEAYDPLIGAGIADLIDERTKLVWVESPGSGTMEVPDVPAIVAAAKRKGALVGCDNTWASPLLFKPLEHGADFATEALTKYVGGHSDLLLGSITVSDLSLRQRLKDTLRPERARPPETGWDWSSARRRPCRAMTALLRGGAEGSRAPHPGVPRQVSSPSSEASAVSTRLRCFP